jgi:hypothetical protein
MGCGAIAAIAVGIGPWGLAEPFLVTTTMAAATESCPPGQVQAQIEVEGEPQTLCLMSLRDGASGLTVDVAPEDFQVQPLRSATGTGWRLVAQGGSVLNPQAYLQIEVDSGDRAIGPWLQATLAAHPTWQVQPPNGQDSHQNSRAPYRWATKSVHFTVASAANGEDPMAGQIIVGQIQGRSVRAIIHLPLEYAEGYGPRIHQILNSLRTIN